MLDENLLITASKAARGITAASAAVDEAKRLVEEAKAGVETAKAGLAEAKANYDAVIAEIAGTGLSASKARKAVEDMLRIFADVGIIDATSDDSAPAEPKAPRRKKAEAAPAVAETAVTEEPASDVEPVSEVTVPVAAPEPAAVIEEAVAEPEAPAPVEPTAIAEVPAQVAAEAPASVADIVEIDNGEAIGEIYSLIESSTENEDISVSETLITLLNAADWYSREHRKEALTLDLYREILNVDFVIQAAASDGLDREMKDALETVSQLDAAAAIFEWFLYALDKLENGSSHISFAEHVATNAPTAAEPAVEAAEVVEEAAVAETATETAEVVTAEEIEEEVEIESSDYTPDPEVAEDLSDEVSDDVTLAADDGLVGVEVEDIEEINFLEQPSESVESEEAPAAAETSDAAPAPAAESAAPRGFKRPSFLSKKG